MIPLTIWMNMPSFHQDGLFNNLSQGGQVDLGVVFARETTEDRLLLGWTDMARDYSHSFLRGRSKLLDAVRIAWSRRRQVHIVSGIRAEPSFAAALCVLALARSKFVVYAEAPNPARIQTGIRALLRRSLAAWLARRALGFLAVSHFAEQFYIQLGFPRERVYPFGYFQNHNVRMESSRRLGECREVVFVGQLIPRKGVDLLLEAARPLFGDYPDLRLTVIGGGSEAKALQAAARSLGIGDRVNFEGALRSEKIHARLASADVLVLPSRWDGWGMVVNEALSVGVPVIVSDRCGAADLIQHGVNGFIFRSGNVDDLRRCLRRFADDLDAHSAMQLAAESTGRVVSAQVATPYLIECLKHMTGESENRPTPPWLPAPVTEGASH